ncbi:MAG: FAD-dependent oxidoreductase [Deltaproteobacteria bacterium]|nr:FAD-dependent oxidoreductase [Deltaproteobacteria bacterium]MBW2138819.1 FAD-dependent oxidoreductase [Deltaproteobacteria bacterium]
MSNTNKYIFVDALFLATVLAMTGFFEISRAENAVDHSLYGELLRKYVNNGRVDYGGFKKEEARLDRYLEILERVDTKGLNRNEQLAFYVNAYNAWTIKLILGAYPGVESIKDLGSFLKSPWKKKIARIDGKKLTLDNIEHDIIRPRFGDPRIHFVVNCASKSCPPLRSEPYRGDDLERQLDEMTKAFINDPSNNYVKGDTLYVSSLFKWYSEDFHDDVISFFLKYAEGDLKRRLTAARGKLKVKYLDYDSEERFCSLGAKVTFGSPGFVDEHSIEVDGKTITSKTWVIATGSSPFIPPVEGLEHTSYITNKEVFSLDHLPESMVILGAGPIASEMAQAFSRLGSRVDVIQRSGQILSREDKDMADEVMKVLAGEGVRFHLNSTVVRTKENGGRREVLIKDAEGKETTIGAETLLVAMGRVPNLEGLGLDRIGVETHKKGIQVDARLRTTQKHIYAAGDVTGAYQFTHAAGYEGGIVISNAVFHLPRKADYTFMPWCTYTDPELASIGMNEKRAREADIKYSVWTEEFKANDRSLAEGESVGKIKMILDEKEKLLGVQILGPRAGELLGEWVAVLNGKVKLSTLASSVHPYPTLGEINKRVAGNYFSPKIFSDRVKKGLRFFFHLKGRACETTEGK